MTFAQLSKVRLEYLPRGGGPEKVVFVHGFQASARIWSLVQEHLPDDRFTTIAINNRGAGRSDAPPDEADFGIEAFADDAFELASQLGWRDFRMVGHSLGGGVALRFAVDHPELLKGLVLLDPVDPDGPPGGASLDGPALDELIDRRMTARRQAMASGGAAGDGIDARGGAAPAAFLQALAEDMRAAPERRLRGSMRSMFRLRLGQAAKSLPMPVLLAGGDRDELIPIAAMLATWAKLPAGAGLHIWHGVGHSPNVDCPEEVAQLIRRFVEETITSRRSRAAA